MVALRHRPQCGPVDEPCSRDATQVAKSRQTRLDSAGCAIGQKQGPYADEAEYIVQTSTAICRLAGGVYDLETISRALGSVGIERTVDELRAMGRRIYWQRVRLRERLGFEARLVDVPHRFFETPTVRGKLEPERVARILESYHSRRTAALG